MIELRAISKSFGATPAVKDLSLSIGDGAFCVLVGPSGCGKSTVLRMINAMIVPDAGAIKVRGKDIAQLDPIALRRSIGYVIQSVGLFPHWTVAQNIAAVPQLVGWDEARIAARVDAIAASMQIDPALLPRYPRELSGGQQQRIGVARALAADPDIILMDEPFAALDPVSRGSLQAEMRRLHAESGKTFVFVTHDMNEALRLATEIIVMNKGRIVQAGDPAAILLRPADDFVRGFLGREDLPFRLLDLATVGEARRRRAAAGSPAAGSPAAGLPAADSPAANSPTAGSPAAGSPAAGSAVAGSAAAGSAAAGSPAAGSPATGSPAAGSPAAGSPAAGSPAAGSPVAGSPAAGSPAANSPTAGSPVAGSPAANLPAADSRAGSAAAPAVIKETATLRQALTLMLEQHCSRLVVVNENGVATGALDIRDILAVGDVIS